MKQFLLDFFAPGKSLNEFYAFIWKENNAEAIRPFMDKEVERAFDKAYNQDDFAKKHFPNTLKETVSGFRYIIDIIMKTKNVGNVIITPEYVTHTAVDAFSLLDGFVQLKRVLFLDEVKLNDFISAYASKGITILCIYGVNVPSELLGERVTSFGMKVIVLEENSINTTENNFDVFLNEFRKTDNVNKLSFDHNKTMAISAVKAHKTIVSFANSIECDCILSVDDQKYLEEQQNKAMHIALEKHWKNRQKEFIKIEVTEDWRNKW